MSEESQTAKRLAVEAGRLIRDNLNRSKRVDRKSAVNLVTDTDRAAEALIVDGLRQAFPGHGIVAEEGHSDRRDEEFCWYIDPLDGTTNFVHTLPHCAVSIALLRNSHPQVAVVFDPVKEELFEASRTAGATLNGTSIGVSATSSLADSLLVTGFPYDRREHSAFYLSYFEAFMHKAHDVRRFGAASLDLCYVAAGRFDGLWEWGLSPWDTAAGWLILEEAGGRVSDFDGRPFDPWQPRIAATNAVIHDEVCTLLTTLTPQEYTNG